MTEPTPAQRGDDEPSKPLSMLQEQPFLVVARQGDALNIEDLRAVPEGSTFYLEPDKLERFQKQLSKSSRGVRLDSQQHSASRKEQLLTLEISESGSVRKYFYRAGVHDVVPVAWSRLDGRVLSYALGKTLYPLLALLALWGILMGLARNQTMKKGR